MCQGYFYKMTNNFKINKNVVPENFTIGLSFVDLIPVLLFGFSFIIFLSFILNLKKIMLIYYFKKSFHFHLAFFLH